jgi:hypothetical protein
VASRAYNSNHRPRELRQRVLIPARVRTGATWADACILNLSSRGLLIQTTSGVTKGSMIELRRGDQLIVARVVWQDGAKAGLRCEERLPVERILTVGQSDWLQLTAATATSSGDRRKGPRPTSHEDSRLRGRMIEYGATVAFAVTLASTAFALFEQAISGPFALIQAALG